MEHATATSMSPVLEKIIMEAVRYNSTGISRLRSVPIESGCIVVNMVTHDVALSDVEGGGETQGDIRKTSHFRMMTDCGWYIKDCIGANIKDGSIKVSSGTINGVNKALVDSQLEDKDLKGIDIRTTSFTE